jgi:Uma2 family endonuclease
MTTATLTPPAAFVTQARPKPYRFTIEAYRKLEATGLFHDMKTMLIDGEILTMTLPSPPHDTALNLTYEFLRVAFPGGHHIRNQQGFDVGTHNDPGPDLAVVVGSIRDYTAHTPTTAVLVIEIADSSLFFDTTTKAELYATAGVSDYWVIDLENRKLLVFRDPVTLPVGLGTTAYCTHQTFGPTDSIAPLAAPTASVRVADLLP